MGGGVGIIGWAILDQYMGYRIPFIIAGLATLGLFVVLVFLFRNIENIKTNKSDIFTSFKKVFSNRIIILVAFIGIASMVSETRSRRARYLAMVYVIDMPYTVIIPMAMAIIIIKI